MYLEIIILLSLYIGHAEQRATNPDGLMLLQNSAKTSESADSINEGNIEYFPIISDETYPVVNGRMLEQNATKTKEEKKEEKQREKEEKKKEKEEEKKRKEEEKQEEKKRKEEEKKRKEEEKQEEKKRKEEEKQKKKEEKQKQKEAQKTNPTKIF